jgi:hypothetical protein
LSISSRLSVAAEAKRIIRCQMQPADAARTKDIESLRILEANVLNLIDIAAIHDGPPVEVLRFGHADHREVSHLEDNFLR